jgi:hypothetical protein
MTGLPDSLIPGWLSSRAHCNGEENEGGHREERWGWVNLDGWCRREPTIRTGGHLTNTAKVVLQWNGPSVH